MDSLVLTRMLDLGTTMAAMPSLPQGLGIALVVVIWTALGVLRYLISRHLRLRGLDRHHNVQIRRKCPHCGHEWTRRAGASRSEQRDPPAGPCPRCGRVSGPGIWSDAPEAGDLRGGKLGTLGYLLKLRDGRRDEPEREPESTAQAGPPARTPPTRPGSSEPLWDRWLDS